jgi:uncharacterized protein (DUF2147 family)
MILAGVGVLALMGPAMAADIVGTWLRSNGESRVRMAPCGGGVCGTITWLKTPGKSDAKVGQQVFYNMKPDGSGMTTKGCVLGGMICKSVSWSRVN